ncbi:MAG: iron dependent repressor, metal binding and dimerization domain protein [Phycisphaerales bacterium]
MATETVENYLKAIYALCRESPAGEAAMTRIATLVGVTTGTATTMVKRLAAAKLARYERFGGVRLTTKGDKAALDILRRHRLIETFLVETLRLDWSVVHAEAERLEHAISPVVLEALDKHLGHPSIDPHGDPIPDGDGKTREPRAQPLASFAGGSKVRVVRITDQNAAFLLFIAKHGLKPGASAAIIDADTAAQSITVHAQGHAAVTMAAAAAEHILCETMRK